MRSVVSVDQLRQPQRTSHAGRAAANDDHVSRHLRPFDAFNRFAKDQHKQFRVSGFQFRVTPETDPLFGPGLREAHRSDKTIEELLEF